MRESLPRRIGLVEALAVVVGTTIGSGIFRSPASIANRLPSPTAFIAVWVVGGVLALCGALTLAEVASALPRTGGIYVMLQEGWGELAGFLFGWSELVMIRAAALGAVATTFAEYALRLFGSTHAESDVVHHVAAVAIVVFALLNVIGVKWSTMLLGWTTLAKYGALVFIVGAAVFVGSSTHGISSPAPVGTVTTSAFGIALVAVLWAYDGWADLSFIGGEVTTPEKTLPRALIYGTLAVIVIYVAANLAYIAVLPISRIQTSPLVAADVAQQLVGSWGVSLVSIAIVLATIGTLNASLLTTPRIFFAMADDGLLFRAIADVHPKYKTPYRAILLSAGLGVVFVLLGTFDQLADTFITAIVPFYALSVAAIFPLRRRATYQPPYRVPGYPIVPALFVLATLYILASAIVDPRTRWGTLAVLGGALAGIPVYYIARRHRR
ncbi:MAG TPA: amino acid permease [Gemmatimonadaceae bacterium]|nr:amino acid permease [Gemmatimonadaceae bacterium]